MNQFFYRFELSRICVNIQIHSNYSNFCRFESDPQIEQFRRYDLIDLPTVGRPSIINYTSKYISEED